MQTSAWQIKSFKIDPVSKRIIAKISLFKDNFK